MAAIAAVLSIGTTYWRSYQNAALHNAAVHDDGSQLRINTQSALPAERVELIVRDLEGSIRRISAGRAETETFIRQATVQLEADERRIRETMRKDIEALVSITFADRNEAISAYADWFFEWKRSYVVLKEVLVSAANRTVEVGRYETFGEAIRNDIQDYFIRHYKAQVLKPEIRDPALSRGIETIARHAQESVRQALARADLQAQLFLARHGETVETLPADTPISTLSLDWDAQKWKAPTHLMEDRAFDGLVGVGTTAGGGILGATVLRPVLDRALARSFASISSRFATQVGTRAALAGEGAIAGTAVLPGPGTLAGAMIGGMIGLAADYALNEVHEAMKRDDFIAANEEALDATTALWTDTMTKALDTGVSAWMQEAKTAVVLARSATN